jgi:anti-anti-sigma factor
MARASDFVWRVRHGDERLVVELVGDLDLRDAAELQTALFDLIAGQGNRSLALDLSGLTFIDSTGLRVLVDTNRRMRDVGGDMVLWNPRPHTRKVLEIAGLTMFLRIGDATAAPAQPSS